jgi:hypothetical protein
LLIDITASLHLCPAGVAGLPSSTKAGSGTTMNTMTDRALIPAAVEEFPLGGLRADDRVWVGSIGRRAQLAGPTEGNSPAVKKYWRDVFGQPPVEWLGPSPIWDRVGDAVQMLSSQTGRKAILLVSDGQASGNTRSYREVAEAAASQGVAISVVGEESVLSFAPVKLMSIIGKDPTVPLRTIAEISGGTFFLDKAVVTPGVPCFVRDPAKYVKEALNRLHQTTIGQ